MEFGFGVWRMGFWRFECLNLGEVEIKEDKKEVLGLEGGF